LRVKLKYLDRMDGSTPAQRRVISRACSMCTVAG
jgi:hypothetical protein